MTVLIRRYFENAARLASRAQYAAYENGGWHEVTWARAAELVKDFAGALVAAGLQPGDGVGILAESRPEWVLADLGTLAARGVTIGVYTTLTAEQTRYILDDGDARVLVVENPAQLAKLAPLLGSLSRLETIVLLDGEPPTGDRGPRVVTLAAFMAAGAGRRADVDARLAAVSPDDLAALIYTSGTTGPPKGARITNRAITAALEAASVVPTNDRDWGFCFLPLAHALQRLVTFRGLWEGVGGHFARSLQTVADDLATARPTIMAAVPRIFEKIYAGIHEKAQQSSPGKQKIFRWALATGRAVSQLRQQGRRAPLLLRLKLALAARLVFSKLRARLGGRVRLFVTGGAPIAVEILEFFDAAGITILEGWGMTETFAVGTLNLPAASRFGTIGRALPGVELRVDHDGELLVRGSMLFSGYHKQAQASRECFTDDGFFRTGDVVTVDGDGYYKIVDRKKDLIITAAGKNVAPQNVENLLKSDPRISQVMVVGDRRNYLVALIAVAPELRVARPEKELVDLVSGIVESRNQELASFERVKKFRLLPGELTVEAGEITPSLKVKRKVVEEKFAGLIGEMYAEGRTEARA